MDAIAFVQELDAFKVERLAPIVGAGQTSLLGGAPGDAKKMLQVALANEISVSELAAAWMPNTPEVDVKIAFARQAGDEAGHFELVADRLVALDFDIAGQSKEYGGKGPGDRHCGARPGRGEDRQRLFPGVLRSRERLLFRCEAKTS